MTMITERVRGYRLLERAGQDGPWTVYLARSASTGAEVLVKTLACHRVDRRALKRIVRGFDFPEPLAAHPAVIPLLEVGATGDGRPYLVTPPHGGPTLAERPGRGLPMPADEAVGLLRAVAAAVAATHALGGVHGRVKPENVITPPGGVALTGFAMSALMSLAELPGGTLPSVHAAPEDLRGRPPVPASDVYALGSMLYELLAGRPAFEPDGPAGTTKFVHDVLTEIPRPLPPTVPPDLATLLARTMSKDPATRPTATDLATVAAPTPRSLTSAPHTTATTKALATNASQTTAPPLSIPEATRPPTPWPPSTPFTLRTLPSRASVAEPARGRNIPLLVVGASALAALIGVGGVALAVTSGRLDAQPAAATEGTAPTGNALPTAGPAPATPQATDRQEPSRVPTTPATSPPAHRQAVDPAAVAAYRPKGLKVVSDGGTSVTLAWKTARKSSYPTVIQQAPGQKLTSATSGTSYTVGGLNPATGYCFKVGTVIAVGQPSSVAWSSALCIRGATETTPGAGQDKLQPPIVLPPATPPS
ncbi:protein kinase [Nonomuraea sp. B12E4]|uniref:serine/threonine protein kinase n=1 Tax=Nonomuraea sp. B12E4 TaxID=3153564 RepID=UPI00325CCDF3